MVIYSSKLSPDTIPIIRERLMDIDYNMAMAVFSDVKDPTTALIISVCEFFIQIHGISRFYIGDIGIGVAKLLTCGGCDIWWLIDLFFISDATRERNSRKVLEMLSRM